MEEKHRRGQAVIMILLGVVFIFGVTQTNSIWLDFGLGGTGLLLMVLGVLAFIAKPSPLTGSEEKHANS